jgi:hypothetical protein
MILGRDRGDSLGGMGNVRHGHRGRRGRPDRAVVRGRLHQIDYIARSQELTPNAVTSVLLIAAGIVLVLAVPAGLYVLVAPILAALVGGVASTWLLLTKITE